MYDSVQAAQKAI